MPTAAPVSEPRPTPPKDNAAQSLPSTYWVTFSLDVVKALIGTFAGAGLAYFVNLRLQRRQKRLDQLLAGNVALATLKLMINTFLTYKKAVEAHRSEFLKAHPNGPLWLHIRPIQFDFDDSLRLDIRSLSFLIEHKNVDPVNEVLLANSVFMALAGLHQEQVKTMMALQDKIPETPAGKVNPFTESLFGVLGEQLGRSLTMRVESLNAGILTHLDKDEAVLWDALRKLRVALVTKCGEKEVIEKGKPN